MLLIIRFLAKIFSILNSEISPKQIAAGFAFGALIGLIPLSSFLPYFLLLIAFILNVNLPAVYLATALFKIISFIVDPLANQIGFVLLVKIEALKSLWTQAYNTPIVPYSKYNNTIVMGSLVVGILLLIPLYFLAQGFVQRYRTTWQERFLKLKIVQIVRASTFYKYYLTYKGIKGE